MPPPRPAPVGAVTDRTVPSPAGDIAVRIYWPAVHLSGPVPVVVFAHGGGFVFCDLDSHDELCRAMTNGIGAVVVSVDYRLAPESPWPAAAEDVYAVADWATQQAAALGADPGHLLVAGDSAGGNLAAVTALMARDRDWPAIAGQLLIYPVIAADFDTASYRRFGVGYYNTAAAMAWYWDQYVPDVADRSHPYASPLRARLTGLPPAVVITAGCDPLCSEGDDLRESTCRRWRSDDSPRLRGRDPRLHHDGRARHLHAGARAGLGRRLGAAVPLIGMRSCRRSGRPGR